MYTYIYTYVCVQRFLFKAVIKQISKTSHMTYILQDYMESGLLLSLNWFLKDKNFDRNGIFFQKMAKDKTWWNVPFQIKMF